MDRFVAGGDWRFHDVLSSTVPKTDRGRTDHAFGCDTRKAHPRSSRCFHISAVAGIGDPGSLPEPVSPQPASPMPATTLASSIRRRKDIVGRLCQTLLT